MKLPIAPAILFLIAVMASPSLAMNDRHLEASGSALGLIQDTTKDRPALKDYDLGKKNLALSGYDPVAYFPEYGGKATKGLENLTVSHRGVLYRFGTEAHRRAFLATPDAFEPMYGGWCAWAMADGKGSKTEANPKSFTIENGKLYVFYDGFFGDTCKSWNKAGAAPKLKAPADTNWTRISGEAVREDPAPRPEPEPKPAPKPKDGQSAAAATTSPPPKDVRPLSMQGAVSSSPPILSSRRPDDSSCGCLRGVRNASFTCVSNAGQVSLNWPGGSSPDDGHPSDRAPENAP